MITDWEREDVNLDTRHAVNLPSKWALTTVGKLYSIIGGGTPSTQAPEFWDGDIPWITSADIGGLKEINPRKYITTTAVENSATNLVPAGSLIVVTRVGLGKVAKTSIPLCFSQDSQALVGDASIVNPDYALYYLSQAVQIFRYENRGTTIAGVTKKQLAALPVPVAPYQEQLRIVAKIEELFTQLDAGVATLKRLQANLQRYKASVLKAACEGKLVPQDPSDEPASQLLERILAERRARWEEDLRAKGKDPKKARYEEPVPPDTEGLPHLPEGWVWATFDQLSTLITKGSSPNWQGFDYQTEGIVFIRSQNIGWGKLELDSLAYLSGQFNEKEKKSIIREEDVLFNIVGASIGRSAKATAFIAGGNLNQAVAIIRLLNSWVRPDFVVTYLLAPDTQHRIDLQKVDVARANISLADIRGMPVPLPSLTAQQRIVAEVERRLSVVEEIEVTIDGNLKRAERLRQAILRKAFEGKLVPQDPSDEPASTFLERSMQQVEVS
jgi:type I restriction enzyme, S subunit